jgi:N-acetylglucosaminyldiphosphoundecaprenol N-acetyl-beta-D-mannosaminyltransferase
MSNNTAAHRALDYGAAPAARRPPNVAVVATTPEAPPVDLSDRNAREVVHVIDDYGLQDFTAIAANFGQERFGYVVTPNVDHLIRYYEDASFRAHYRDADFILMDSRFAARLVRLLKGVQLPVCTGSDLTAELLGKVIQPDDPIVMIGGSEEQTALIMAKYGLTNVRHYNPPMGFINDSLAVEQCLSFIESVSPFRFCFLAVGCPQQEMLAQALRSRGVARGLALCIGASLNFLSGAEKRAPLWMQRMSLEWLYRLLQNPRRLAHRYLVRCPRIFLHLQRSRIVLRNASAPR